MKSKRIFSILVVSSILLGVSVGAAFAGAYETAFTTSITYQNVGSAATTQLQVLFYEDQTTTTPIIIERDNLAAGAGTSLYIGGLTEIDPSFQGTAMMVSDQPLVATLVQLPQGSTTVKNRPLSNGFKNGTEGTLIATVLKNAFGGTTGDTWYTVFSVQNVGVGSTDVEIKFFDTSANLVHTDSQTLASGTGYFVDTYQVTQLGTVFNGSVVVESVGGSIISSAMELQSLGGVGSRAFEGLGSGATSFFMPSALCNYVVGTYPNTGFTNTAYAVQNTDTSLSTNVTVKYSNGATETKNIGPGAKGSFNACNASGMSDGFIGSAEVTSDTTPVIAIGKAAGMGLSTAYVGVGGGSEKVAMPYVRWATDANFNSGSQQRTNMAIQNVGSTDIPANTLTVKYVDRNGSVVGTHTIDQVVPAKGKVNSNATNAGLSEFGVYDNGTAFGGGAIIEGPAGSEIAAIARVSSYVVALGLRAGEDYNGLDIAAP